MYFKKIELAGFKSFADKTLIQFEPGVTAIVGPNGCGKSNVSDAIRWVLGEQSAKSLRGSSMEDVIFNGAADKDALNFAEVSLTLSNETRILTIDYDEVTISRRLYRSGESEYLLNKNTVRLKDIHELLLGTGIGTESYSVIEQGKMDTILNAKPEERRVIFEEAAGITKFKAKKKEAQRKLEQTDQNLLRVNDIIQEVKRQISSVERQAKKAEQYKIEFEKMKKLELAVASQEFLLFDQSRRTKENELQGLKEEETKCHEAVSAMDAQVQERRRGLDRVERELGEVTQKEVMAQAEIRRLQDRAMLNRERIGELAERRGNIAKEIQSIDARLESLQREVEQLEAGYAKALEDEKEGQVFLATVEEEFRRIDGAYQEVFQGERSERTRLSDIAQRRARLESDKARKQAEEASLAAREKRLRQDEQNLLSEIREIEEKLSLPLFEGIPQNGLTRLEQKMRDWRDRLSSLVREWLSRPGRELTDEDVSALDTEIRGYTEEIGRLQGTEDRREIDARHYRESKNKLERRLQALLAEIAQMDGERNALSDSESAFDRESALLRDEEEAAQRSLQDAQGASLARQKEKEGVLVRLAETRSRQTTFKDRREQAEKDKNWITQTQKGQQDLRGSLLKESEDSVVRKAALEAENVSLEEQVRQCQDERDTWVRRLEGLRREREEAFASLSEIEKERQEKQKFLDEARDRVHTFQMQSAEIRFAMDRLKERIFNSYQVDLALSSERGDMSEEAAQTFQPAEPIEDVESAKAEIQRYREKLSKMGPVNLAAMDEHQEMTERFQFLTQQEQDLIKAKDDLQKAILKINRTTKELFAETFAKVQGYFSEYFKMLFNGGHAELVLLDESDVLESGIEIVARPPGKKLQSITLLSGGEKALTAVALMFSLFKVRPSPFCILDEIDAPLDETNVERFCGVLKDFITTSQFILITHNKRTMNLADAIYGITMAQSGVSRVVSVKFAGQKSDVNAVA